MLTSTLTDACILIVDDQESNVAVLVSLLTKKGYKNLKTTTDSRLVVALCDEFKPDLILLDLMMPHLDGFQVMEQLRPHIPDDVYLPILILTADATQTTKQHALASGAKDFLAKPLDVIEVMLRIQNLLETRRLHLQQQNQNQILEEKVRARTLDIERQLDHLAALRAIDNAISGSFDLRLVLNIVLEQAVAQLGVDAANILLLNPHTQMLTYTVGRGFRTGGIQTANLHLGESFAGDAILERRVVKISDPSQIQHIPLFAALWASEGFVTYYSTPLVAKGQVKGVLEVFHRARFEADEEWMNFLEALAGQAAIAVDNARLFEELQRSNFDLTLAYDATIEGWSRALDLRDKETEGHTQRVSALSVKLARQMGVPDNEIIHIRRGALLHDIGKMGIPDKILLKPDKLTEDEWAIMRQHPTYAYEMLLPIQYLKPALDIPRYHHEKWDGTGYPHQLKGESVPFAARIFAVVDVWDAVTSDRPYRSGWSKEEAIAYIKSESGKHFDPQVAEIFLTLISNEY
jgi:putative nucleotidyltransferase with HDIG domain